MVLVRQIFGSYELIQNELQSIPIYVYGEFMYLHVWQLQVSECVSKIEPNWLDQD